MHRLLLTLIMAAGVLACSDSAFAVKVNSYTFNDATAGVGGVTDSVGTANGTLIDPAGTFGAIAGGRLDLTANNGLSSNQATEEDTTAFTQGAYVDLPNGILNSALTSGNSLEATVETWFTVEENRTWARVWDFGNSNLGEDAATGASTSDYLALVPQSGSTNAGVSIEANAGERLFNSPTVVASGSRLLPEISADDPAAPAPLAAGEKHHVVVSFNGNDLSEGVGGTIKFYLNGAEVGSGPLPDTMQLDDFSNITGDPFAIPAIPDRGPDNNWIGRSNWGDVLFDGHIDELNIYNTAISQTDAAASFATGPVGFDAPTIYVNRDTGEITVINETGSAQELAGLTVTSALGGLDASGLTAPADFEIQVPANADTINLADTNGTGVDLPASATAVSLGNIWQRSPFEDVEAAFDLAGSDSGNATVVFVGDAVLRSDFDADGDVDLDDYGVFIANANRTVSGLDGYFLGDVDLSGTVDRDDFRLFKADFFAGGGTAAALAAYTVPEPTSTALLALVLVGGLSSKRR